MQDGGNLLIIRDCPDRLVEAALDVAALIRPLRSVA